MDSTYHLYDTSLSLSDHCKYLGVILQSNLKWNRHIEETIAGTNSILGLLRDIQKQIEFKELRRHQATGSHQYQLCDNITKEITTLKQKRFKQQIELKTLQRKQQQSRWYRKRRKHTDDHDESNESTCTTSSLD